MRLVDTATLALYLGKLSYPNGRMNGPRRPCDRPRGMVDWIGADMQKNSEHRTRSGKVIGGQDPRPAFRQHPLAAALVEELDPDSFAFMPALMELARIQMYGATLTEEIVRNVAKKFALVNPGSPYKLPTVGGEVVYYARIGNRIKIGTSRNLIARMSTINPEELMATEPGGVELERSRHVQFRALRTHGEWFKADPILLEHIESLPGRIR